MKTIERLLIDHALAGQDKVTVHAGVHTAEISAKELFEAIAKSKETPTNSSRAVAMFVIAADFEEPTDAIKALVQTLAAVILQAEKEPNPNFEAEVAEMLKFVVKEGRVEIAEARKQQREQRA